MSDIVAKDVKVVKKQRCWRVERCEINSIPPDEMGSDWIVHCWRCHNNAEVKTEAEAAAEWKRIVEASNTHRPPDVIFLCMDGDELPELYFDPPDHVHGVAYVKMTVFQDILTRARADATQAKLDVLETAARLIDQSLEGDEGVDDGR